MPVADYGHLDALAIRKTIREVLNERYTGGYAVLKELVQNADDACAKHIRFTLSPGSAKAKLSTLTRPVLMVSNDGLFAPGHANAIMNFRGSEKAGNTAAVGKFGLGLKSIFHWCEYFIFSHWAPSQQDRIAPCLIAPGQPKFNAAITEEWNTKVETEKPLDIADEVRRLLWPGKAEASAPKEPWLTFVISLRRSADTLNPLFPSSADQPGDRFEDFENNRILSAWPNIWPLLVGTRHLLSISLELSNGRVLRASKGDQAIGPRCDNAEPSPVQTLSILLSDTKGGNS